MLKRKCPVCGKEYHYRHINERYCSLECRKEHARNPEMKRPEVVDRDTKRDNFCGKTFDGWLSSLSKEEYQYLCNHIVINGDAEKGQSFTLYSYEGLPIGRGKGEGLKATEALRGFDLKLSIASDLQLDFLCGPLFEELKGQQGWPDDIFDFEDSFGYTWYLRRDEMEDKKE